MVSLLYFYNHYYYPDDKQTRPLKRQTYKHRGNIHQLEAYLTQARCVAPTNHQTLASLRLRLSHSLRITLYLYRSSQHPPRMVPSAPLIGIIVTSSSHTVHPQGRPVGKAGRVLHMRLWGVTRPKHIRNNLLPRSPPPFPHLGGQTYSYPFPLRVLYLGDLVGCTDSSDGVRNAPLLESPSLQFSSGESSSEAKQSEVSCLGKSTRPRRSRTHGVDIRVRSTRQRDFKAVGRVGVGRRG